MRRFALGGLMLLATLINGEKACAQRPVHYIVGIDRSASRTPQQMKDMQNFVSGLVKGLSYGDALSMVQVFRARSDEVVEFRDSIPALSVPGRPVRREELTLNALRDSFGRQARRLTDTVGMKSVTTTDIVGFLRRASGYAQASSNRRVVIVVLSDMLQSVPGMDFERINSIPTDTWIAGQMRDGLLPRLSGACVVAVGAEEGTPRAVRVRDFWAGYTKAAGATLKPENYRTYMESADIHC